MELLNSNFFISGCVALLYFILKYLSEKDKTKKKAVFKDAILVGIVSYAVLIFRTNFTTISAPKTTVFTNDPQF